MSATTSSSTLAYLPKITAVTNAVKAMLLQNKTPSPAHVKAMEETCVICGGPHPVYECLATDGNTFNASAATGTYNQGSSRYRSPGETNYRASNHMRPPGSLPSNTIANPRGDLKVITTRNGVSYDGPMILTTSSPLLKEVEREPEAIKDKVLRPKLERKLINKMLKFLQIFQRLHFDLSFADALLHMHMFASTFKSLLSNKDKLFELANTLLNENFSAVLLKNLPKKLGDPDKFLIPCDFLELD
ncbi:hypothetical protein Tco_1347034 [Tanacetum coccineum]